MEIIDEITGTASATWNWAAGALPNVAAAIAIFVFGYLFAAWAGRSIRRVFERAGQLDATVIPVIVSAIRYAIIIMALVAALGQLGVATTSILAALGAAGLAIGLALQGTLANIAAGIMLLWLRPFRTGDYIDASGIAGTVREIGLFATQLDTFDGVYRFVPNSELWNKPLFNYTRNPARMTNLEIGISYGSDIEQARRILLNLASEDSRIADDPAPNVFVNELADSAVTLRYRVWIATGDFWSTQRYLLEETKRRLDQAGIEIPFPQRVVHIISDDAAPSDTLPPPAKRPQLGSSSAAAQGVVDGGED
jgi:small conductance mechanosensitive channel